MSKKLPAQQQQPRQGLRQDRARPAALGAVATPPSAPALRPHQSSEANRTRQMTPSAVAAPPFAQSAQGDGAAPPPHTSVAKRLALHSRLSVPTAICPKVPVPTTQVELALLGV